jgi:hypothetical protein
MRVWRGLNRAPLIRISPITKRMEKEKEMGIIKIKNLS